MQKKQKVTSIRTWYAGVMEASLFHWATHSIPAGDVLKVDVYREDVKYLQEVSGRG